MAYAITSIPGYGKETYMNLEELKQFIKQVGPSRLGLAWNRKS
jgi:hypothetical protein